MSFRLCKKVLLSILLLSTISTLSAFDGDVSFFQGTFSQLQNQAQLSRTPYFVYFHVDNCEACTKMQQETFIQSGIVQLVNNNFLAYEVDGLDFINGIDIATKYGVTKFPTTIVFGPDGNIRNRTTGFITPKGFSNILKQGIKEGDRTVNNRTIVSRSPSPNTMRAPNTNVYGQTSSQPSLSNGASTDNNWVNYSNRNTSSYYQPNTSILSSQPGNGVASDNSTKRMANASDDKAKESYIKSYMDNRLKITQQNNNGYQPGYRSGYQPNSTYSRYGNNNSTQDRWVSNGNSYVDDHSRSVLKEATSQGYYPQNYYTDPPKNRNSWSSNRNYSTNNYGSLSYVDDQVRKNPERANSSQYQDRRVNGYSSQNNNSSQNQASFLDHIDGSQTSRWAQNDNYQYRLAENGWNEKIEYAIDKRDGRRVAITDLEPGILLQEIDGEYFFDRSNSAAGQLRVDNGSGYRMAEPDTYTYSEYGPSRGAEPVNTRPVPVIRKINPSVPGMANYSPEDITENTFGIVIGNFVSLNKLKHALKEFEESNDEAVWVFGEKINDRHYFIMVMGEYRGEQEAVSSALRMGASSENLEVVNLANLK